MTRKDAKKGRVLLYLLSNDACDEDEAIALIDAGAALDMRGGFGGDTPLIRAAGCGFAAVVSRMLEEPDTDLHAVNDDRISAIIAAVCNDRTEVVRLLLAAGADANSRKNADGTSALEIAVMHRKTQAVALLLDAGAKTVVDASGVTCLMWSVLVLDTPTIRVMLEKSVKVDAADANGCTALMRAAQIPAQETAKEVISLLINAGATAGLRDNDGLSAEDYALKLDNPRLAAFIAEKSLERATEGFRKGTARDIPVSPPLRPRRRSPAP